MLNRLQNTNDLLVADARDGDVRRAYRDSSTTWVDWVDDLVEIDGGKAVAWTSEGGVTSTVSRSTAPANG